MPGLSLFVVLLGAFTQPGTLGSPANLVVSSGEVLQEYCAHRIATSLQF